MRSTMVVEDATMLYLKEIAAQQHKTLKTVINDTINLGLGRLKKAPPVWKCESFDMGGDFDYTRAWERIDGMEADAVAEKLELRK